MAPKLVIRTLLINITILTEKTIIEALPYFRIALCTTNNPSSDATKHIMAKTRAACTCSIPNNRYCNPDMVAEKRTMNEHVAAVTYTNTKKKLLGKLN